MFESSPGFLSLGIAEVDKASFVSLSTWETREQAHAATTKAAEWVQKNSRDDLRLRENFVGDLTIDTDRRMPAGASR